MEQQKTQFETDASPQTVPNSSPKEKKPGFIKDTLRFTFIALLIVVPFRMFIAQPFLVNGASMDPTFENGHYLIVDELSYQFKTPERGSVLIFKYPLDPKKYFIKRVIGLPSETVRIEEGKVFIENKEHPQGFELKEPYIAFTKNDTLTTTVKDGEYFVMGDNRSGSLDSRYWGPLPEKFIIGRPFVRLYPLSTIGLWPGTSELQE